MEFLEVGRLGFCLSNEMVYLCQEMQIFKSYFCCEVTMT